LATSGSQPSDEDKPDERLPAEVDYDLMVLESLAALDRPQVPDDAVMAVAHASEMAVLEVPHVVSMHWPAIPSIFDRLESNRWAEGISAGSLSVRASLWWHQILLPSEYGPAIQ
jgi:hypothetical protein